MDRCNQCRGSACDSYRANCNKHSFTRLVPLSAFPVITGQVQCKVLFDVLRHKVRLSISQGLLLSTYTRGQMYARVRHNKKPLQGKARSVQRMGDIQLQRWARSCRNLPLKTRSGCTQAYERRSELHTTLICKNQGPSKPGLGINIHTYSKCGRAEGLERGAAAELA
jgi:hypothetical protein